MKHLHINGHFIFTLLDAGKYQPHPAAELTPQGEALLFPW
jgi:hypothetical protein